MEFFCAPSDLQCMTNEKKTVNTGGSVVPMSLQKLDNGIIKFRISDENTTLQILYNGTLPAMFNDQTMIIAKGNLLASGEFESEKIFVKHDQNYSPKNKKCAEMN